MLGVINYGVGNLTSIQNSLKHLSIDSLIIETSTDFDKCDKIILPGVGAFKSGMDQIIARELMFPILKWANSGKPLLGICLGMQLLFNRSFEFGETEGLSLLQGEVYPLSDIANNLSIPHVGWNDIVMKRENSLTLKDQRICCYFVHSYYCKATDSNIVIGQTEYGKNFDSIVEKDNIFGCQFHPEKSQTDGLNILKNFAEFKC